MGTQVTRYKTKDGKTRRISSAPTKAGGTGSPEVKTGDGKNNPPATSVTQTNPANKGA